MWPSTYRTSSAPAGTRSTPVGPFSAAAVMDLWRSIFWCARGPWPEEACRSFRRDPRRARRCWPCPRPHSHPVIAAGTASWTATAKSHCRRRPTPSYTPGGPAGVEGAPLRIGPRPVTRPPTFLDCSQPVQCQFDPRNIPLPSRRGADAVGYTAARPLAGPDFPPSRRAHRHTTWAAFADTKQSTRPRTRLGNETSNWTHPSVPLGTRKWESVLSVLPLLGEFLSKLKKKTMDDSRMRNED